MTERSTDLWILADWTGSVDMAKTRPCKARFIQGLVFLISCCGPPGASGFELAFSGRPSRSHESAGRRAGAGLVAAAAEEFEAASSGWSAPGKGPSRKLSGRFVGQFADRWRSDDVGLVTPLRNQLAPRSTGLTRITVLGSHAALLADMAEVHGWPAEASGSPAALSKRWR